MNWWKGLKGRIISKEPLKKHTTFRIGGRAALFVEPRDINDLKLLVAMAGRHKVSILILGAGSNILAGDHDIEALIVKLNSAHFKKIIYRRGYLEVGSGLMLWQLVMAAKRHGLSGMEFLAGIPGTVGGALAMNAGAWGKNISDTVESVEVMDRRGNRKILTKDKIRFGYRRSSLAKYIILGARLKLTRKDRKKIGNSIKKYLEYRRNTQDISLPNAGCIFKNPGLKSAGRLIEECGLKGKIIGGACISHKHANFILNKGNAKAVDVLQLMALIKRRVKTKFRVALQPEIKIWS